MSAPEPIRLPVRDGEEIRVTRSSRAGRETVEVRRWSRASLCGDLWGPTKDGLRIPANNLPALVAALTEGGR